MDEVSGNMPVKGASIHYEIEGKGKILLLVPGGNGTAIMYSSLRSILSRQFRVVTYDRRGFLRSPISKPQDTEDKPSRDETLRENAEDAAALIKHVSATTPVFVFASSGSATIVIELLIAYPNLVAKAILHEPIMVSMFSYTKQQQIEERISKVLATYRISGAIAAQAELMPLINTKLDRKGIRVAPVSHQLSLLPPNNMSFYFENELPILSTYKFEFDQIQKQRHKMYLLRGSDTSPELASYPVRRLSQLLGLPLFSFPGGHTGYVTHVEEFATSLADLLLPRTSNL